MAYHYFLSKQPTGKLLLCGNSLHRNEQSEPVPSKKTNEIVLVASDKIQVLKIKILKKGIFCELDNFSILKTFPMK